MPNRNCRWPNPELGIDWLLDERFLRAAGTRWTILRCMQQPAQSESGSTPADFAAMLAALASPAIEDAIQAKARSENEFGDDVVMLSYERALKAHGRYKPAEHVAGQTAPKAQVAEGLNPDANRDSLEGDLRTASVTVRLSKGECASLHQRAAEAGLTVSAYLRSCTVEADALRAQVKAVLAELRSATANEIEGAGSRGAGAVRQHAGGEVRLSRVLGRIGNLCLGISIGNRA